MIQNQNYQKTPFLSKCEAKRKGDNSPPLPCENYCETTASAKKLFHNVLTKKLRLMERGLTSFFPISPHYHIGPQSHLFLKFRFTPNKNTTTYNAVCHKLYIGLLTAKRLTKDKVVSMYVMLCYVIVMYLYSSIVYPLVIVYKLFCVKELCYVMRVCYVISRSK